VEQIFDEDHFVQLVLEYVQMLLMVRHDMMVDLYHLVLFEQQHVVVVLAEESYPDVHIQIDLVKILIDFHKVLVFVHDLIVDFHHHDYNKVDDFLLMELVVVVVHLHLDVPDYVMDLNVVHE
jgi:hypothetical protein